MLSSNRDRDLQLIVNRVFRLHGALLRYGDLVGSRYGVTGSQWQVLAALRRGSLSVAGIARMIDLKRQSVQRTVDLLVERRLVTMIPNPANARSPLAVLTVAGQRIAAELAREQQALLQRCARRLTNVDLVEVSRCLKTLQSELGAPEDIRRPSRRRRVDAVRLSGAQRRQPRAS